MVGLNRSDRLTIFEKNFLWSLNRYSHLNICQKKATLNIARFPNKNTSKTFSGGTYFLKNKNTQKNVFAVFLFPNKTLAFKNKRLFQTFCVALFSFVESELSSLQIILVPYKCVLQMTCS